MLQYLKHGNRSNFDLKIIQGLFEEYCSDSNEEENVGKVMNSEEEYNEFYSLARPDMPNSGYRPRQSMIGKVDISSMNIFNKEDGLISIGRATQSKLSSTPYLDKSYTAKKTLNYKKQTDVLSDLNKKKFKASKTKFKREEWETRTISKIINTESEKKKIDFKEIDNEDSDENNITKARINNQDMAASIMDLDQEDFIEKLENEITNRNTKDNSNFEDTNGKKSSKEDIIKNSSDGSKKKDSEEEEEKKQPHNDISSHTKVVEWNNSNEHLKEKKHNEKTSTFKHNSQYKDSSAEHQDVRFA